MSQMLIRNSTYKKLQLLIKSEADFAKSLFLCRFILSKTNCNGGEIK